MTNKRLLRLLCGFMAGKSGNWKSVWSLLELSKGAIMVAWTKISEVGVVRSGLIHGIWR